MLIDRRTQRSLAEDMLVRRMSAKRIGIVQAPNNNKVVDKAAETAPDSTGK